MQVAIQVLIDKRQSLISERNRLEEQYNQEISEIENAIETLSGKKVWETLSEVEPNSILMTDEYPGYQTLAKDFEHYTVNHSAKEFVNEMAHINGMENFWSHLKRGIDGIYHQISKDHLQAYIDEFLLRFNTRKFQTQNRFDLILSGIAGKRLTYNKLITS